MSHKVKLSLVMLLMLGSSFTVQSHATQATIENLLNHPETYSQDQVIELKCYFSRESKAWLHLLKADAQYTGFFGYDIKNSFILSEDIVFPYFLAPRALTRKILTLRKGDPIIVKGRCFKHHAVGKESIGVLVEKLQIIGEDSTYDVSSGLDQEKGEAWSGTFGAETQALDSSAPSVSTAAESYTIQIGGNTISGLQFGEKYTVNGAEFVVTKDQMKGGGK